MPTFTTQRAVVWSIASGEAYANIDNNGLLTVRPGVSGETDSVLAVKTEVIRAEESSLPSYRHGGVVQK